MKKRRTLLALAIIVPLAAAIIAVTASQTGNRNALTPAGAETEGTVPVLTEFGDFQCPHCATFAAHAMPAIDREFVRTGQLAYRYRHYPFLGNGSYRAAEAAECARSQGKFREYHDSLYRQALGKNENSEYSEDHTASENLAKTAERLKLDMDAFRQCREDGSGMARVEADKAMGRSMGVRGTPTLFMNGGPIRWMGYDDLRTKIRDGIRGHRGDREETEATGKPGKTP